MGSCSKQENWNQDTLTALQEYAPFPDSRSNIKVAIRKGEVVLDLTDIF